MRHFLLLSMISDRFAVCIRSIVCSMVWDGWMRNKQGGIVSKTPVVTRYRQRGKRIGGIIKTPRRKRKRRDKGIGGTIIKGPVIGLGSYAAADRE